MDEVSLNPIITYSNQFSASYNYNFNFFNTLFLNIVSLRKKLGDLTDFISRSNLNLQIVILNETRLKVNEVKMFNIPNFKAFHLTRDIIGGGASIFVKESFSSVYVVENFSFEKSNFLILHLERFNIFVGTIYKPPDSSLSTFLPKMDFILSKYKHLFLFGDFNVNIFNKTDSKVKSYHETVETNCFRILNSTESRMYSRLNKLCNTFSCIDHVITDDFMQYNFSLLLDSILETDHRALILNIHKQKPFIYYPIGKLFTFEKIDHQKMISDGIPRCDEIRSCDSLISKFIDTLKIYSKSITVEQKFRKPFMNKDIFIFMIIRDNYFSLTKKYPLSQLAKERLKYYRNLVVSKVRKAKREISMKKINGNLNDAKKPGNIQIV